HLREHVRGLGRVPLERFEVDPELELYVLASHQRPPVKSSCTSPSASTFLTSSATALRLRKFARDFSRIASHCARVLSLVNASSKSIFSPSAVFSCHLSTSLSPVGRTYLPEAA